MIDDTVYFTFGSYMSGSKPKYIDLSKEEKNVHELEIVREIHRDTPACESMVIQKWGYYWVYCVFGDGGAYGASYTLFDPDTKILGEKHTEGRGWLESNTIVGVTKDGLLIKAYAEPREENPEVDSIYFYNKVTVSQLHTKTVSTTLLTEVDIPANTTDIFYREEDGDVYMIGDEVWIYNFDTKETRKITPQKNLSGFLVTKFIDDDKLCLNNIIGNRAIWNMVDNSVEYSDIPSCESRVEDESIKMQPLLHEGLPPQLEVVEI